MKKMVLVLLVSIAFAQEPVKFRGAFIGEPLSDFVDCSSHKGRPLKEGYKTHGKLCEGKSGSVSKLKNKAFMGVALDGEVFGFNESRVVTIMIYVANADWEKVRDDLSEKLGPPSREMPQVYQNGFGAHWEYGQGFWQSANLVAFAKVKVANLGGVAINKPFSNTPETEGIEVTITTPEYAKHSKLLSTSPNSMD
jgi:hypothetical protein